ncbi:hypothetical protein [Bradyrhizobium sp. WSM1417]|uniref:hypothetical protein n=1 Tax=Bradyrhizobium sp. WSM1417 TaxID=754500 RepID=UPI0004854231|nr:hypothetical protein [Bradyrhizobium sp. WSM1417]
MIRAILAWLMLCSGAAAQVGQMPNIAQLQPASAAYAGPGDVVASASGWWGFRAYSAAKKGTKAINVCNVSDVACADMNTDAITGALVITLVGGSDCSSVTCTIKTVYDQSGGTNCSAAACDLTNSTIANRPTLQTNCANGQPCAVCNGASSQKLANTSAPTLAQPISGAYVGARTGTFTTGGGLLSSASTGLIAGFAPSTNTFRIFNGTSLPATASDSTVHSFQTVSNNTSSVVVVDGSATSGTSSTGGIATNLDICNSNGSFLTGQWMEAGFWTVAFTSTQYGNLRLNQKGFWNTP